MKSRQMAAAALCSASLCGLPAHMLFLFPSPVSQWPDNPPSLGLSAHAGVLLATLGFSVLVMLGRGGEPEICLGGRQAGGRTSCHLSRHTLCCPAAWAFYPPIVTLAADPSSLPALAQPCS